MSSYDWNWTDRELEARDAFIGATNQRGGVEGYLRMLALIAVHLEDDHGMGLQLAADLIAEREAEYYVENTDEGRWEWFAHGVYGGAHGVAGMSRAMLKFARQALSVEQAMPPRPAVQGLG